MDWGTVFMVFQMPASRRIHAAKRGLMKICTFIEDKFWVFLVLGIVLGFIFPAVGGMFSNHLMEILMLILFLTFLRMDFPELVVQAKRPFLLTYIIVGQLVIMPIVCFLLTWPLDTDLRLSIFLLAALPAGTAAPAMTEIVKGRTTLSLMLTVLTCLAVPVTIPVLFYIFFSTMVQLDYLKLFTQLLLLILIPMICARIAGRFLPGYIEKGSKYVKSVIIVLMSLVIMVIIGKEAGYILSHLSEMVVIVAILFVVFFFLQIAGYFMVFWLDQDERIAVSMSKAAMNNVLGIVLAMSFFGSKVALVMVLSELPWDVMPVCYKLYRRWFS